jgi:hypothetical protein
MRSVPKEKVFTLNMRSENNRGNTFTLIVYHPWGTQAELWSLPTIKHFFIPRIQLSERADGANQFLGKLSLPCFSIPLPDCYPFPLVQTFVSKGLSHRHTSNRCLRAWYTGQVIPMAQQERQRYRRQQRYREWCNCEKTPFGCVALEHRCRG